ncbi:MAG: hypothetical protein K8I00_12430 [Candidatus Omnitrophica bacterium]|nr:hypothetical protein [Candidatus Omnitrophota bacterium]
MVTWIKKNMRGKTLKLTGACSRMGNAYGVLLRSVNVILLVLACGIAIYSGRIYQLRSISESDVSGADISVATRSATRIKPKLKTLEPLPLYLAKIQQRDLFEAPWEAAVTAPVEQPGDVPVENPHAIMQFTRGIRLVGIISDNDPKAVVEDIVHRKTLIMSIGDEINGARLHKIYGELVVFKLGSELIELYP